MFRNEFWHCKTSQKKTLKAIKTNESKCQTLVDGIAGIYLLDW